MKAMVFAAGLGTRLRPYTNDRPKALVEVQGKTLLEIVLLRLKSFGVKEVVVNVHHYADMVVRFLNEHEHFGLKIVISDERDMLLDTGGGLLKAKKYLEDAPFLIHNVDILSDFDLEELFNQHRRDPCLTTLAVRQRKTSRYLEFDRYGRLCGWINKKTGERKESRKGPPESEWAYSGMSIIDPTLFAYFPTDKLVFSIIDVWLEAAKYGVIRNFPHDHSSWLDVGKPEALEKAAQEFDI
ncbi:MAG: nucleotidyltransferase family protein [Bacteroidota bacterium]